MKDKNAVALGRKGGKARARVLTAERRKEIARQGYAASPLSSKHANIKKSGKKPSK
jgi:hypothetical protein